MKHLLNVFSGDAASVSVPVTLIAIVLVAWFVIQLVRKQIKDWALLFKQGQFWFIVVVIIAWIIAIAAINSDYRPYNPKKDGPIPEKPKDDGRVPAQELIPK